MEASTEISSKDTTTTTKTTTTNQPTSQRPHIVLLLENSRKNNNWGPVLRCASAFGIQTVVFVGFAQCSVRGSHGADQHVNIIAFPTVQQAVDFLRQEYHQTCHHDLDNSNNGNHHENDASTPSPTTTTTTAKSTTIIGLLGAVPGGYSSDGCVLRLNHDDGDDNDGAEQIDKSSNTAGLVQAVVVDDDSSSTMSPTLWSSHRSYPVSGAARMKSMMAGGEQQEQQATTTKTVVVAISKDLHGLPLSLSQHCEAFCHVPHVAIPGHCAAASSCDSSTSTGQQEMIPPAPAPPLLDLPTTLSIALHHITAHLGYREGEFQGHKFQVSSKNKATLQKQQDACHQRKIQEHRAQEQKRQEQLASDVTVDNGGLLLWQQEEQKQLLLE